MISIGLPAIKTQFLHEAIQSVLKQRFLDFELIIFNDRSDEKIKKIVSLFDDPRLRYFEGEAALAVVENWNRVLLYARGEYFVLFADDDRYHPDFLLEMNAMILKHPACNIFHCRVRKVNSDGELMELTATCPEFESGFDFIFHRLNGDREQFAPEFVVKTKNLVADGGFVNLPLAWGSDDLTWFRLAEKGGICYNSKPLVDWRQSVFQISETGDVAQRLVAVEKFSEKLRELVDALKTTDKRELLVLSKIKSLYSAHLSRQKAHLVAVNARYNPVIRHTIFFFKSMKKHQLKIQWFLYSLYAKLLGSISSNG